MDEARIDVVGDIHGQGEALDALLAALGYDEAGGHRDGRRLLFLGDLVDRGPASLEVSQRVMRLCAAGALCLMGNHEYNLVEWRHGRVGPKKSNAATIADVEARPDAWAPVLAFFETLPLALEMPTLRVTHAVWHLGCFAELEGPLATPAPGQPLDPFWAPSVVLHAPYEAGALRAGVPTEPFGDQWEKSLEVFLKGYESLAPEPFVDNDGKTRDKVRTEWWVQADAPVPDDRRLVFGHYWNMPPVPGAHEGFVPPHPSGHPRLRAWFEAHHEAVASDGRGKVPRDVRAVCVDFNGVTKVSSRACVGAYRHPEGEVVWAAR